MKPCLYLVSIFILSVNCGGEDGGKTCPPLPKPCLADCDDPAACIRGNYDKAACRCVPSGVECVEDADCPDGKLCFENRCACFRKCAEGRLDEAACECVPDGSTPALASVKLDPGSAEVKVGESFQFTAFAVFDDSSEEDVTLTAEWSSSDEAVASVAAGKASAVAAGAATITASFDGVQSNGAALTVTEEEEPPKNYEARALWVTRWNFTNAEDVRRIIDEAAGANFNMVLFQVRGVADAYYRSLIEPWAKGLSGTLGQDPGWDPLGTAVDQAHAKGIQLHAWINTLTAWSGAEPPPESVPRHVLLEHPDWVQVDQDGNPSGGGNDYVFLSPGIPEVQEHVAAVVQEIARGYEVDGVHLDYIRYAGPQYSHDSESEEKFAAAAGARPGLSWEDWQRGQVTGLVGEIYSVLRSSRPSALLSAAVWGIYKNEWGWNGVSQGFHDYYQDSRGWLEAGSIDAICPMIYWPPTHPAGGRLDFRTLVEDFVSGAYGRHVYAGMQVDTEFETVDEMIDLTRELHAQGNAMFAYSYVSSRGFFDLLAAGPYAEKAEAPPKEW